ncbi:hypothetical protein ACFQX7_03210 [Luedemannella flava]
MGAARRSPAGGHRGGQRERAGRHPQDDGRGRGGPGGDRRRPRLGSPLVEQVALHVVEQVGDPEEGAEAPLIRPDDIDAEIADVLDRARAATALLTGKAGDGEAAAYKFWLVGIAEAVITAASTGGVLGIGGEWVSESERRFIDELADVLES